MPIDVEAIVIDALLSIVEDDGVPLERITVKLILERSGVSRQTFYNHFLDKNDLIAKVYERRIIGEFDTDDRLSGFNFRESLEASLHRMRTHGEFSRQALRMGGQNNLTDYALEHSSAFDLAWHQSLWGDELMPEELRFATEYHAMASSYMTISWVLSGFPVSEAELADLITRMRSVGMDRLFEGAKASRNPYLR